MYYYNLGLKYDLGQNGVTKDELKAFKYFEKSAKLGNAWSKNVLGFCYKYGTNGQDKNLKKGMYYYHLAASEGSTSAQYNLGRSYEDKQDYKQASRFYRLAEQKGHLEAIYNLGICYENGWTENGLQDINEARCLYQRAAFKGHEGAVNKIN